MRYRGSSHRRFAGFLAALLSLSLCRIASADALAELQDWERSSRRANSGAFSLESGFDLTGSLDRSAAMHPSAAVGQARPTFIKKSKPGVEGFIDLIPEADSRSGALRDLGAAILSPFVGCFLGAAKLFDELGTLVSPAFPLNIPIAFIGGAFGGVIGALIGTAILMPAHFAASVVDVFKGDFI